MCINNSTSNYIWFKILEDDVIDSILTCWFLQRKTSSVRYACFWDRNIEKERESSENNWFLFSNRVSIYPFQHFDMKYILGFLIFDITRSAYMYRILSAYINTCISKNILYLIHEIFADICWTFNLHKLHLNM